MQKCMSHLLGVAKDFVPVGTFCLILIDKVKVINNMSTSDALAISARQMFASALSLSQSGTSGLFVLQRFLADHDMTGYYSKLKQAASELHPMLFFGGSPDDYEQVIMQRQSAEGELATSVMFAFLCTCHVL